MTQQVNKKKGLHNFHNFFIISQNKGPFKCQIINFCFLDRERMEEGLPQNFDVMVIGTGVTESLVSAAASRNGHTVLHLDPREYYGSSSATLNFDSWIAQEFATIPTVVSDNEFISEDKLCWRNCVQNVDQVWYDESQGVKEDLDKNKRKFNIDLFPQVILAREDIIELLIKSDVSRYLEFLRVGKLFTKLPQEEVIVSIPLSRSDIFTSKSVSLGEKRCLVKFIEAVMQEEKPAGDLDADDSSRPPAEAELSTNTFDEMATACKLTPKVKHLIRSVVENVEDNFSSEETFQTQFISRCRQYLKSIGRFGNQTPYLWPLYGVSEICQAFCRLSAVYGSIFILKRFINSIEETAEGLVKIKSENDEFHTKYLVIGPELNYIKGSLPMSSTVSGSLQTKRVGRGVIVTRGSNLKADTELTTKGDGICLYKIGNIQVLELSSSSQAVPKNYRLLQITFAVLENYPGSMSESPRQFIESQLQPFVDFQILTCAGGVDNDAVTDDPTSSTLESTPEDSQPISKPQAIYGSYFWMDVNDGQKNSDSSSNIFNCGIDSSTDLTSQVNRAIAIFNTMFPGEEVLPKPPDPEESGNDDNDSDIYSLPNHFDVPPAPAQAHDNNEDAQQQIAE